MKLGYDVIYILKGDEITGTGEKDWECEAEKDTLFHSGKGRTIITVEGYIDKNFLSKDKLAIRGVEKGTDRESSIIFDLVRFNEHEMMGTFSTTVSDASGSTIWTKKNE